MTIQGIRYFSTIAKLENLSRAAEVLHVSQSSLTKTIHSIESDLGTELFDRSGKKIRLNEAGARFLESCEIILEEMKRAVKDINHLTQGTERAIRICTSEIPAEMLSCMAKFKEAYSDLEYEITALFEGKEFPDINDYDMIIYPDEPKYKKFRGFALCSDKYYLAVNLKSGLARNPSVSVQNLSGRNYIFFRQNGQDEHPYRLCQALGIEMSSVNFVDSRDLQIRMISSGIGVGFVPEGNAAIYRSNTEIRLLPVMDGRFVRKLNCCFKREKHLSETAGAFCRYVKDYFNLKTE